MERVNHILLLLLLLLKEVDNARLGESNLFHDNVCLCHLSVCVTVMCYMSMEYFVFLNNVMHDIFCIIIF